MKLALRLDVSQRLSESPFVLTGAIFPRDLAKSQSPNLADFGPFLKEVSREGGYHSFCHGAGVVLKAEEK